jgi:hypothetical protein
VTSHRDERGAVMILFALMLVASVILIALVLDVGMLRADRKSNKSTADSATAAGLLALEDKLAADGRPHPWRGVCAAYNYVKANNAEIESFATEEWTDQQDTTALLSDPCGDTARLAMQCAPGVLATYARFHGVAQGGRITVDIKSGYQMPDPEFGEDPARAGDNGDPAEQGCDHLSVVIRESQPRGFSAILGGDDLSTRIRSVGRVTLGSGFDAPVSLLLLERRDCRALRVESVNSRVVVEHSDDDGSGTGTDGVWPGLIHSDSDGSLCATDGSEFVLEGRVGADGGPTIVAKNATLPHPETGSVLPARIGVFAKFFNGRPAHTPFPTTIGETDPVAATRQGRRRVDDKYLTAVRDLASVAGPLVALGSPPDTSWTWFKGGSGSPQCKISGSTLPAPFRAGAANKLWFDCPQLWIVDPLVLTTPNLEIVVTGEVRIDGGLEIRDLRKLWVRGKQGPNQVGVTASGPLLLNTGDTTGGPTTTCPTDTDGETPAGKVASVYVDAGAFEVRTTAGRFRACSTFMLLRGGVALPATPGTLPVPTCAQAVSAASNGTFSSGANGLVVEWTAPNEIANAQPTADELLIHPFEDIAFWTEASGPSKINGGGGTSIKGVFFLPNANDFEIHGNGTGDMPASAQFIACRVFVSGAGTLKMIPDAFNFVLVPSFLGFELVR